MDMLAENIQSSIKPKGNPVFDEARIWTSTELDQLDKQILFKNAYQILENGSQIIHPLGPCFFSPCMTDLIDKFGVRWCLFV